MGEWHCLVSDGDGHWYVIPHHKKEEFEALVEQCEGDDDAAYEAQRKIGDFEIVNGPHTVKFQDWVED